MVSPQSLCAATAVLQDKAVSVFLPALESVSVLKLKSGTPALTLSPADMKRSKTSEVTALLVVSSAPVAEGKTANNTFVEGGWFLAVGYANGHVGLFKSVAQVLNGAPCCLFYALGHKIDTNVLCLAMDSGRGMMCSAGQDTDLTVWDVATQEPSFRLKGHRGGVVSVYFVPTRNSTLISGSADGLIKVWDLDVRQCVQTVVASDTQVTSLLMDVSGSRLYCGLRDQLVKVYNVESLSSAASAEEKEGQLVEHGSITRKTNKPVTAMSFSHDGQYLLVCTSKTIEVYRALSSADVKKKVQRKKKRRRDDGVEVDEDEGEAAGSAATITGGSGPSASEEVKHLRTFFLEDKIRSAVFVPPVQPRDRDHIHILVTYGNNSAISYVTTQTESSLEGASVQSLSDLVPRHQFNHGGHRNDIKYVTFADDDQSLVSMSAEGLKLWNVSIKLNEEETDDAFYARKEAGLRVMSGKSQLNCTGSFTMDGLTCCAVASSDLCCVGTQEGAVAIVNVASSELIATQTVHVGAIRDVVFRPDKSGFTSLGADRRMVIWTLALLNDSAKTVTLQLTQEIELNETPLFIEYSPDKKLVGVGLQDNNIQLFYADSMKPFLVLFGHKLPATAMSFTTDGTLAASVGMDKSLRFWGTDFGDCHRSIHAHDDYVTSVQFVPDTHYCFTSSMDGTIKYWDGDNWTMIQKFSLHQRGIWSVAVNGNGTVMASGGVDKCLRLALRTEEILFPQEEEERMAREAMDEDAARRAAMQKLEEKEADVGVAGQVTAATTDAAENLMEALDLVSVELQKKEDEKEHYQPHLLLRNKTVWEYLWSVIESIRPSEIRHVMGSLTSTHVNALLTYLEKCLENKSVLNYETAAKIVLSLVAPPPGQTHGKVFLSVTGEGEDALRCIQRIRLHLASGLNWSLDRVDFNIAGLKFLMGRLEQSNKVKFFDLSKIQGHKKKYNTSAMHK